MAAVVLLVILSLSLYGLLVYPFSHALLPVFEAPWGLGLLLLLGLWLFSGTRRDG
jgi:hypothetical protein